MKFSILKIPFRHLPCLKRIPIIHCIKYSYIFNTIKLYNYAQGKSPDFNAHTGLDLLPLTSYDMFNF